VNLPNRTRSAARPRLATVAALVALGALSGTARADDPPAPDAIPALDAWVVVPGFGDFRIRFDREQSPNHVAHFLALAGTGFYDGLSVHRIVPRLLVQAGAEGTRGDAPRDWVIAPPDYRVAAEAGTLATAIRRGTVAMALQDGEPGTAGTEWFVALRDEAELSGRGVPIGVVIEGMETLDKLEQASTWVDRRPLAPIPFQVRLGPADQPEGSGEPAPGEPAATGEESGSGDAGTTESG